jgi:HPt (histidine-containing phosphotransfer) domain-containing protein
MTPNKPLIDKKIIVDLLYGDEEYVNEFLEASVESFTEFKNNFEKNLESRDDQALRNAGHKIKPIAQMLHLDPIIEMYEKSKELLEEEASDSEIEELIKKMTTYCDKLVSDLHNMK